MHNIKLTIAYMGTHYLGFQKTKMGPSIESNLQASLETLLGHRVQLQAASRTDRGVHAKGQVLNFITPLSPHLEKWQEKVQQLLPSDITLVTMEEVPRSFHPTLDARGKEYHYRVSTGPIQLPFERELAWHFPFPLQTEAIIKGAKMLSGTHDFSAFSTLKVGGVRTVKRISIIQQNTALRLIICGDTFLYKMVRTLVGTLIYVGCGKLSLSDLPKILASCKRRRAGITAPAHGLYLERVFY